MAKKKRKIQDYDPWYSMLRHYVDAVLKLSYSKIIQTGRENIPDDGAVIYSKAYESEKADYYFVNAINPNPQTVATAINISNCVQMIRNS